MKKNNPPKREKSLMFSKLEIVTLAFLITLLAIFSFWRVIHFGFWRDDWGFLWAVLYEPNLPLAWNLHPGTKYEDLLLVKFFGLNTYLWQGFGIFLRIIASLAVAAMVWSMAKSKKAAVITGLIMAASYAGLETVSWRSVHIISVDIILICLGFFFFFKREQKRNMFFALTFFSLAGLADPARCLPVLGLVSIWEAVRWWIDGRRIRKIPSYGAFIVLLMGSIVFVQVFNPAPLNSSDTITLATRALGEPNLIKNFLGTIGNMLLGWMKDIPETGGLSYYITQNAKFAFAFLISIAGVGIYMVLFHKSRNGMILLFLNAWIALFYLPNWIFEKTLVIGGTHRYIGLSAVGYYVLLGILISFIRNKKVTALLVIIILILNIRASNIVLKNESTYRDKKISDTLWNKIYSDVPIGETESIFMYLGTDGIRGFLLDWSGGMPFALERKISDGYQIPISTADQNLILKLLCEDDPKRPSLTQWIVQKDRIKISHVHAWEVNNGEITNVSQRERAKLLEVAKKSNCTPIQ